LKKLLHKNTFAKNVGLLAGGTAGTQALTLLIAPLLTRLYSPEDFGLVAVYSSLLAMISSLSSLTYEMAIPLPKDDEEAAHIMLLSLLITAGISLITTVISLFFADVITRVLGVSGLVEYFWLLPVGVILTGVYKVFNNWAVRIKAFSKIAATKVHQSLAATAIQLLAFNYGSIALLLAQVVGQTTGSFGLARLAITELQHKKNRLNNICQAAFRYRKFPLYSSWEVIVNIAAIQLPSILFASSFGVFSVGLYSLSNRVLTLPMSVIGHAVSQVFFSDAAKAHHEGRLKDLVNNTHSRLAHIVLPPLLMLIVVAPDLFSIVFGERWRQAGVYAVWMSPWIYFQFVSSPISTVYVVLERLRVGALFQLTAFLFRGASLIIGIMSGDILFAIALFSVVSAICYIGLLVMVMNMVGNHGISYLLHDLNALFIGGLCVFPLIIGMFLKNIYPDAWLFLFPLSLIAITGRYWIIFRGNT